MSTSYFLKELHPYLQAVPGGLRATLDDVQLAGSDGSMVKLVMKYYSNPGWVSEAMDVFLKDVASEAIPSSPWRGHEIPGWKSRSQECKVALSSLSYFPATL